MNTKTIIIIVIVALVGLLALVWISKPGNTSSVPPGKFTAFATCLKDKGAIFYGAFWCPHCRDQKTLFGDAVKLLPYVECSTPDGNNQLPICKEKKVESYPTWDFADGGRLTGLVPLDVLASTTGCVLPQ